MYTFTTLKISHPAYLNSTMSDGVGKCLMVTFIAILLCLAPTLLLAQRLGIFVTKAELNEWRKRAYGTEQETVYNTSGDVSANSPDDWNRILSNATSFKTNPNNYYWAGPTLFESTSENIITDDGLSRIDASGNNLNRSYSRAVLKTTNTSQTIYVEPDQNQEHGRHIRDAAFYLMVNRPQMSSTDINDYRQKIKQAILRQKRDPLHPTDGDNLLDFWNNNTSTSRWPRGRYRDVNPLFVIGNMISNYVLAMDFLDIAESEAGFSSSFSSSERAEIYHWFEGYALNAQFYQADWDINKNNFHSEKDLTNGVIKVVRPTLSEAEAYPLNSNVSQTIQKYSHLTSTSNGHAIYGFHMGINNRRLVIHRTGALIGLKIGEAQYVNAARRYAKDYIKYGMWNDGACADLERWTTSNPDQGWAYMMDALKPLVTIADALARNGDNSVYTFNTIVGARGNESTTGNEKSLIKSLKLASKFYLGSVTWYGTNDPNNRNSFYLMNGKTDETGNSFRGQHDIGLAVANLYYKDTDIKSMYMRKKSGYGYWSNPTMMGRALYSEGDWGIFPGVLFMFGQMENVVDPYNPKTTGIDRTDEPGGTITALHEFNLTEGKSKAFDNSSATKWLDDLHSSTWIQYQFGSNKAYAINKYTITSANDNPARDPKNWKLQGSNNGIDFVDVDSRINELFPNRFQKREFTFTNAAAYKYYRLLITLNNGAGSTQLAEIELFGDEPTSACSASGSILREYWATVNGKTVAEIPLNTTPTSSSQLPSFESPSNVADYYGQRIRGYICAPATGNYTFYIASNDDSELYLSSDDNAANKTKIAFMTGWAYPNEWTKFPSQQSLAITLQEGQKYYIEALHKENNQSDNLAVGWTTPNNSTITVIPGSVLSPFVPATAPATFYRAINVNGAALSIDSKSWEAGTATNFSATGNLFSNQAVTLTPSTDAYRATMIRSSVFSTSSSSASLTMSAVPAGTYAVFVYVWEDNTAATFDISLEGTLVQDNYNSGAAGSWARLYLGQRSISDGTIQVTASGGDGNLSGIEVHKVSSSGSRLSAEVEQLTAARVYPNPFTDQVIIRFEQGQTGAVNLTVVDLLGKTYYQRVQTLAAQEAEMTLDLAGKDLKPGVYFLQIADGISKARVVKLIKH